LELGSSADPGIGFGFENWMEAKKKGLAQDLLCRLSKKLLLPLMLMEEDDETSSCYSNVYGGNRNL
jgi:hypothetical protein